MITNLTTFRGSVYPGIERDRELVVTNFEKVWNRRNITRKKKSNFLFFHAIFFADVFMVIGAVNNYRRSAEASEKV